MITRCSGLYPWVNMFNCLLTWLSNEPAWSRSPAEVENYHQNGEERRFKWIFAKKNTVSVHLCTILICQLWRTLSEERMALKPGIEYRHACLCCMTVKQLLCPFLLSYSLIACFDQIFVKNDYITNYTHGSKYLLFLDFATSVSKCKTFSMRL